jgi:hypothetical protein
MVAGACLGPCRANPIAADDAAAQPAQSGASGAPSGGDRRSSSLSDADDKMLTQERTKAMAAARDPALIPIDMQGVGAQAHPAPSALPKRVDGSAAADGDELHKLATSARDWMHDVFGRPDNVQDGTADQRLPAQPGIGGDLGLPVETQASGVRPMAQRTERPVEVPPPGAGNGPRRLAAPMAQETAGAKLLAESAQEYSIQQALRRCRDVLVHPLTWVVILLIGVTRIAMTRNRR